jgi:hypothetical protein
MEGTAWDARQSPPARVAARTSQQPGLILAAAWVGGSVEGCPWRFFGDHRGAPGGVRAGEHGAGGWGMARGDRPPLGLRRERWGCAVRRAGCPGCGASLGGGLVTGGGDRRSGRDRPGGWADVLPGPGPATPAGRTPGHGEAGSRWPNHLGDSAGPGSAHNSRPRQCPS